MLDLFRNGCVDFRRRSGQDSGRSYKPRCNLYRLY